MTEQIESLYREAKEQTLETLPAFLQRVSDLALAEWDYDVGIHAVAISAVAASWAMDAEPGLGMSGASANGVLWQYMIEYGHVRLPARLVEYDRMLYPQHAAEFEKTLTSRSWAKLQVMASDKISGSSRMHPTVQEHLQSIIDGIVPFGYRVVD